MKAKISLILSLIALTLFLSAGSAFAASKWIYVGTLTLASGDSRVDYVDVENVFRDEENRGFVFWVMSETKSSRSTNTLRKLTKYLTRANDSATKTLEWHVYDQDKGEIMRSLEPAKNWDYPENFSLLAEAIDIAWNNAK